MVATWKPQKVKELEKEIKNSKVVALIKVEGIPSNQFQMIRKKLDDKAKITVTKNTLMAKAIEKAKIKGLADHIQGPTGMVFTNLNPFKLNKILKENKGQAAAKKGDKAPYDIIAHKGETPLPAGPVIGELQQVGVKARIDAGKIIITEDSLLAKEGEIITEQKASIMNRLDIKPMEIGLELSAAYEDGVTYPGDILRIDEKETLNKLGNAYNQAFNLCINAGIINKTVITPMLSKAQTQALNLALSAQIINKQTIKQYLSKANNQMLHLRAQVEGSPIEPAKKEDKPEPEPKPEEKTEDDAASAMASMFD